MFHQTIFTNIVLFINRGNDIGGNGAELVFCDILGEFRDGFLQQKHCKLAVAHFGGELLPRFTGATIDDCHKVICGDDAVLACLQISFAHQVLLLDDDLLSFCFHFHVCFSL